LIRQSLWSIHWSTNAEWDSFTDQLPGIVVLTDSILLFSKANTLTLGILLWSNTLFYHSLLTVANMAISIHRWNIPLIIWLVYWKTLCNNFWWDLCKLDTLVYYVATLGMYYVLCIIIDKYVCVYVHTYI